MGDVPKGGWARPGVSQVPQTPLPWSYKEHIPHPGIPAKFLLSIPAEWDTDTATFPPSRWDYFYLVMVALPQLLGAFAKLKEPH